MKPVTNVAVVVLVSLLASACSPDLHAKSARRATPLDRMWSALVDGEDGGSSAQGADDGVLSTALPGAASGRGYKPH